MSITWDPLTDMPDLRGKVAVVTGGSSGLGFAMVRLLALRGAKVYFTTRSETTAQKTLIALRARSPELSQANINWLLLDMTDLTSITAASDQLKRMETRIHLLINNAGTATSSSDPVGHGWEPLMAVHYIGPFVFINRVLPLLKNSLAEKGSDVRIVTLGSTAQSALLPSNFKFKFNSPDALAHPVLSYPWQWQRVGKFFFGSDMIRYAVSKAAAVIFAQELQRRLDEQGLPILSVSVHPGEVATETFFACNYALMRAIARISFLTSDQGAVSPLFAATAPEVRRDFEKYKGKFMLPIGKVTEPNPVTRDDGQVRGLWENSTSDLNKQLFADGLPPLQAW
ncbi:putative carbonyl reductase [Leptodontidium sp. MPI-SDFR-AT-0119]|nr:putative carbonyl reductase [Leptodontidium sp. MPI-SDFR-AT-0119]